MTAHIEANKGDISNIVIMSGDPLRTKFIADNYLDDCKCINTVRNMLGYTGTYKGKKISVMSHGMGIPSIGIYSFELYNFYNVDTIIRVGTAGSYCSNLNILDLLLVKDSYSESTYSFIQNGNKSNIIGSSEQLNEIILDTAKKNNIKISEGRVHSTDVFYTQNSIYKKMYEEKNCLAVEMETFGLFHNAKVLNKKAACILTISDSFINKSELTSKQREQALKEMIELALNSALNM